jgi:hypothetical protein
MNLWSPSGVVPATRVANQLTITASQAAIPQIPAQISWGMARISRNAVVRRLRSRLSSVSCKVIGCAMETSINPYGGAPVV